jgi:hypothetical protein
VSLRVSQVGFPAYWYWILSAGTEQDKKGMMIITLQSAKSFNNKESIPAAEGRGSILRFVISLLPR